MVTPPEVRIPWWLATVVVLAVVGGAAAGLATGGLTARGLLRAGFYGAAGGYAAVSVLDFWEHFRLEKQATGRWLAATAIPVGESINHALTSAVVVALLVLARPLPPSLEPRDWLVIAAPSLFLLLGWRDEVVYHRRRAAHREDIMHTIAHLAAAAMLASFLALRLTPWRS